ncbi:HAD-IA family hydrolase [Halomonas sp. MCCC 1A17488]|uniref:HAD-IA family hydrolase n=1 Tax=Billgrantia sulfidoxydans TaxID=2733484 RepID=A0ABX7W414_9GAMM|nr:MULTISPECIES: HAD-IA family hydrolase [Halomonas]MCE8015114.1 HAD-IA family hydrolase [Halomonas sp. MCCC 1A17488]MCG3238447.1 HAD-IA family hydrolase [Halomonas sp. MCCC 1A17488]QPP47811.1 HAD-IA family hydrolase [Halomonas sp. SS10-MC5]QTP55116.1 HAD-IA family hydrolase [Halomonas sulfidoxydans]
MTASPHALLFDLDGTLVDTAPDLARATNALRAHHGLAPLPYPLIRAQVSNGGSALVTLALGIEPAHQDHDAARQFLLDAYGQAVAEESCLFPHLDRLLASWEAGSRPWGIVTNKPRAYAAPLVEALGLAPGALLCADDLPQRKPAPEPLWAAAEQLGVPASQCWYIGDHLRDMQAARAAGMVAVAVGYGYIEEGDDYREWPADCWFETCEKLVEALLEPA